MGKVRLASACYFLLCCALGAGAQTVKATKPQKQDDGAATEREVRLFFDSYAEDLRQHRRESIANRYDPRGVFFLGNGRKTLESFETVKNLYLTKWAGPKSFEWKDVSVEVLSPEAAVVVGRFEWQTASGQLLKFSYTGLLIKREGKWRIRVEDESSAPAKAPPQ